MIVSFYHFGKKCKENKVLCDFSHFVHDCVLQGKVDYGLWWTHIDEYLKLQNIHVIQYESLLADPFEGVKALAAFLDKSYSDDEIRSLVAFTSFKTMQAKNEDYTKYLVDINVFEADLQFFRKGKIGDWRSLFTDELSRAVDEAVEKNLKSKLVFNYGSE
jgi:hypothetical protein